MLEQDSISGSNPESEEEENSEYDQEDHCCAPAPPKPNSAGALKLRSWLNKTLKIKMTDGRTLMGVFLCTDRDANVILGSCSEFLPPDPNVSNEDVRMLGLVMIPGKHIVSVHIDVNEYPTGGHNTPNTNSQENLNYV
ncbi:N-alpha-acetyltransferase 38, NatC auxiliary subunit isoform X2 [Anthonomus grandis grandis]|uniref:N-alpha-acetyltransferase 38, NatC auxiliary subunit isoform X2 n=1 Tax=Anthonomus grandis grandis TaxID=2921223 RepID=UPI0021650351|nr:N-alpha-acetyltransferase 38, NatC auxiliary subunit isoform X2 [Anthonomus grandis grandis]